MHKPALLFDDKERLKIVQLMRDHVDEKGLEWSPDSRRSRRPRTLFLTSMSAVAVKKADEVFKVSLKEGVCRIPKESVSDALLV